MSAFLWCLSIHPYLLRPQWSSQLKRFGPQGPLKGFTSLLGKLCGKRSLQWMIHEKGLALAIRWSFCEAKQESTRDVLIHSAKARMLYDLVLIVWSSGIVPWLYKRRSLSLACEDVAKSCSCVKNCPPLPILVHLERAQKKECLKREENSNESQKDDFLAMFLDWLWFIESLTCLFGTLLRNCVRDRLYNSLSLSLSCKTQLLSLHPLVVKRHLVNIFFFAYQKKETKKSFIALGYKVLYIILK